MTPGEISAIVVAVVSLAGAIVSLLRAEAARIQAQATQKALSEHVRINAAKPEG